MHVLLVGARPETVVGLHRGGHDITLLYEAWEAARMSGNPELEGCIARKCAVDSYRNVESLWSGIDHLKPLPKIDAALTVSEYAVVPTAILGKQIGAIGLDPAVAMACRDKAIQKTLWTESGIPTAKFLVLPDAAEQREVEKLLDRADLHAPFVIKPLAAGGSENVSVVDSPAEIAAYAEANPHMRRLLVEEHITAPEWHFDGIVKDGRITNLMVSRYVEPLLCTKRGEPSRSVALPPLKNLDLYAEVEEFTTRALAALSHSVGVFHFEAFGQQGSFIASELACRPGGSLVGAVAEKTIGVDLWAAATQLFTNDEPEVREVESGLVHGWVNLPSIPGIPNMVREEDLTRINGVGQVSVTPQGRMMYDMSETTSTGIGFATVSASDDAECRRVMDAVIATVRNIHEKTAKSTSTESNEDAP
ncbi:acetyl-CoA carboxylase biotin carboxylase subunit family protein [Streptomyces sp. R11]|uniref:Acetyl-CoA carboxylase biotin carboxylase subunit family protein n=1 Tax=Streptomyces sp. R11 TaxID=3238625 RepID=A0AB39NCP9_9ACTN